MTKKKAKDVHFNNGDDDWGRRRVVIEGVEPNIDDGQFAIKRVVGDIVEVEADVFTDGHDKIDVWLLSRHEHDEEWQAVPMEELVNDRWKGEFEVNKEGLYFYTIQGWVDRFKSWRYDLKKRVDAGQDVGVELLIGARLIEEAAERASGSDAERLLSRAKEIGDKDLSQDERSHLALDEFLARRIGRFPDRSLATTYDSQLPVRVDRYKAQFSSWYELFPRSMGDNSDHGTFKDVEEKLPYIASMGFDVLYLPPVHPIGREFRKGKNNTTTAEENDVGSPWAIGSKEGGHKSLHPDLGSEEDFRRLINKAKEHNIEIAMDIAYQCAPDHPYVKEHDEWFRHRPDGTIQYAENPPKKYQDIYPFDFESDKWQELYQELKSVIEYWVEKGIRIFRVDNPHTKPFPFWQWLIRSVKEDYPDVLFLAEAFTRPKVMQRLAKLGFTQSYTYFTWRNTKWELTQYLNALTQTDLWEYFRPNFWPNTPDILPEYLQVGGRPAFVIRLVLAATLSSNYGIYGPAYELCENEPIRWGAEEYLNSEKYEVKDWKLDDSSSLHDIIARVNQVRHEQKPLQSNANLQFHEIDNEQLIAFSKRSKDNQEIVLVIVNLDINYKQSGWLELPLEELGLDEKLPYQAHDLISDTRYLWNGPRNFIELDPHKTPAHIFRVRRRVRTERDFDYYM